MWNCANMETRNYWSMLMCWVVTTGLAVCLLNKTYVRTNPCNILSTTNVTEFDCHGRELEEMPNVSCNATYLDLSQNRIKTLKKELGELGSLETLNLTWINTKSNLDNNLPRVNITTVRFTNLKKLRILSLDGFGLSELPDSLPKSLTELSLNENNITSLSPQNLSALKHLTHFYMSRNCNPENGCLTNLKIDDGTFSSLQKLRHLSLSYNNLTYVPRDLPNSLDTLELASSRISSIGEDDFKQLTNLTALKIQGNCPRCHSAPYPCIPCINGSIDIHERAFHHLKKLKLLNLAGNSLSVIKTSWFENLTSLKQLYLSYNFLMKQIQGDEGAFLNNLRLLETLDLSFNYNLQSYPDTVHLASAFANLTSLRTLHIQGLVFKNISKDSLKPLYKLQNLTTLDIGINFIVFVSSGIFNQFHNLSLLYLSENRLYPITNSKVRQSDNDASPPRIKTDPKRYIVPQNLAKEECLRTGWVLDLSRNNLFFISPKQFNDYSYISCLNLSTNGFTSALNGTEFTSLPNLKYLDLSYNRIDFAYDYAFYELTELEVLDLSNNPHYFTVPGVTKNLIFLKNLPKLRVLNMSSNSISILTTKYMCSDSLKELQFQNNQLGKLWNDPKYYRLFWNLTNLTYLDVSHNKIRKIPQNVYKYLPVTLKIFRLNGNSLTSQSLDWTLMRIFTQLENLSLGYNSFSYIAEDITKNIPSLRYLDLGHNKISHLADQFFQHAVNLEILDLSENRLSTINQSTTDAIRKYAAKLSTLFLHGNNYRCTCDIQWLINWILDTDVTIPYLVTSLKCHSPYGNNHKPVVLFDDNQCNVDSFYAYLSFTLLILFVTFGATLMHIFYWDFSYVFYYTKAKIKGYQHLSSGDNIFDAFITYDTKDPQVSEWVLNHLRVQLEEQGDHLLPICLEERDWLPGCPILDSLTQSIRQSRKTVFVLTHSYVKSGSFKMAMYLAHQRLLEENEDVIVLLLLERVLQNSHFVHLRKRLCSHSVLEWPLSPAAEPWFWQCLRNAIRVENKAMYNNIYSRYFNLKNRLRQKE